MAKDLATLIAHLDPISHLGSGITYDNTSSGLTATDAQAALDEIAASAVTDHGALTGLSDDDHTQYVLAESSVVDRSITVWDGTGGRNLEDTLVSINTSGEIQTTTGTNLVLVPVAPQRLQLNSLSGSQIFPLIRPSGLTTGFMTINQTTGSMSWVEYDHGTLTGIADDDHTQYMLAEPSATDDALVKWDTTTGRNVQNSVAILTDAGALSGLTQLDVGNLSFTGNTMSSTSDDITISPSGGEVIFDGNAFFADNNLITFGNTVASPEVQMGYDGTSFNIDARVASVNQVIFGENASNIDSRVRLFRLGVGGSNTSNTAYINADIVNATGRAILNFVANPYSGTASAVATAFLVLDDEGTQANFGVFGLNCQVTLQTTNHTTYTQVGILSDVGMDTGTSVSTGTYDFKGVQVIYDGKGGGTHTGGAFQVYGFVQESLPTFTGAASVLSMGGFFQDDLCIATGSKLVLESALTTKGDSYFAYDNSDSQIDAFVGNSEVFNFGSTNQSRVDLGVLVGATSGPTFASVGGTIEVQRNNVGNVGTGEDDLHSFSLPADSLNTDDDYLVWTSAFTVGDSFTLRAYFGTTKIYDSGLSTPVSPPEDIVFRAIIIRTGAAAQRISMSTNVTSNPIILDITETLSGALTMKFTGEAVATDDIIQKMTTIRYYPAPL